MNSDTPKPIQDIRAPGQEQVTTNLLEPEIQHGIPVKSPSQGDAPSSPNPISSGKQFVEDEAGKNDTELDNILKDVTQKVKKDEADQKPKAKFGLFKKGDKRANKTNQEKNQSQHKTNSAKTILAAVASFVVVGGLSVAAYYAFRPTPKSTAQNNAPAVAGKVGTSAASSDAVQAAGGTLVQPSDLSDLSSSLQTKINSLNDAQDFNSADLSDQKLGL